MDDTADGEPGLDVVTTQLGSPRVFVISLRGEADLFSHPRVEETFTRAGESGLPVVVDLSALVYGDELLLGLLLKARFSGELALVGPICDSFRRRLSITGTESAFDTHATLREALDSFAR